MIAQHAPYSLDCAQHHFEKETSGVLAIPTLPFLIHIHTNTNTDLLQYKVAVQSFHCFIFKIYFMSILFNLCGPCVLLGPREFKRGSCIPRTGVTGGCEPMDLGIELGSSGKTANMLLPCWAVHHSILNISLIHQYQNTAIIKTHSWFQLSIHSLSCLC